MIILYLPWPPSSLSPNARLHWAQVAKAKRIYRQACWASVLDALAPRFRAGLHAGGHLSLCLEFSPPSKRKMDRDNLLARMKSGLDGVCDALGIDDSRFDPVSVSMRSPLHGGRVKITIAREGADQ